MRDNHADKLPHCKLCHQGFYKMKQYERHVVSKGHLKLARVQQETIAEIGASSTVGEYSRLNDSIWSTSTSCTGRQHQYHVHGYLDPL